MVFLGFPMNKMLCLTISLLKGFTRFLTGCSYGLQLETGHLDDLWFATIHP